MFTINNSFHPILNKPEQRTLTKLVFRTGTRLLILIYLSHTQTYRTYILKKKENENKVVGLQLAHKKENAKVAVIIGVQNRPSDTKRPCIFL